MKRSVLITMNLTEKVKDYQSAPMEEDATVTIEIQSKFRETDVSSLI